LFRTPAFLIELELKAWISEMNLEYKTAKCPET
jgi:hypothetical protein